MMSKPIFKLRTVLSAAALSACVLSLTPTAHAGLLGGATGGVGGALSPRSLDLTGQGRAHVARDGNAQLPRGEKLRDVAGGKADKAQGAVSDGKTSLGEAKGSIGAVKGAATDKAQQAQGKVSGMASGTATTGGAIAMENGAAAKSVATDTAATAGKTAGSASASGSAGVKHGDGGMNASVFGEASVSR